MNIKYEGNILTIDQTVVTLPWPIQDVRLTGGKVVVLLDSDSYVTDPSEKSRLRAGGDSIRNLLALSTSGELLWEAELPSRVDYYYRISSVDPLVVNSFSSFRCEVDINTGRIIRKEFHK